MTTREPYGDLLSRFLRFQGFRVLSVELREATRGPSRPVKMLSLEDRRGFHDCGACGRRQRERLSQETDPVYFRDCSLGDVETYLEIYPWRMACLATVGGLP